MATSVSKTITFHLPGASASADSSQALATGQHSALGQLKKVAPGSAKSVMRRSPDSGPPALRTIQRMLASHTVVAQAQVQPMSVAQAFTRAQQMRVNMQRVKVLARQMLKKREFVKASDKKAAENESEEWLAALHIALSVQASDAHDDNTAALTPFGEGHTKEELATLIREQISDDGELSDEADQFLEDVLGASVSPDDEEEFVIALRQANDDQMMKLLRDKQGLASAFGDAGEPADEDALDEIREAIEQYQAESTGEGQQALIGFNIAPAIAGAPDYDALKAVYKELVMAARSWVETMQLLLARFGVDRIEEVTLDLQKAHAADIKAATPSHDLRRLGASQDHLQNTKLLRTVFAMGGELIAQMNRLLRVQHAHP
jgi:hypothetical protein